MVHNAWAPDHRDWRVSVLAATGESSMIMSWSLSDIAQKLEIPAAWRITAIQVSLDGRQIQARVEEQLYLDTLVDELVKAAH